MLPTQSAVRARAVWSLGKLVLNLAFSTVFSGISTTAHSVANMHLVYNTIHRSSSTFCNMFCSNNNLTGWQVAGLDWRCMYRTQGSLCLSYSFTLNLIIYCIYYIHIFDWCLCMTAARCILIVIEVLVVWSVNICKVLKIYDPRRTTLPSLATLAGAETTATCPLQQSCESSLLTC